MKYLTAVHVGLVFFFACYCEHYEEDTEKLPPPAACCHGATFWYKVLQHQESALWQLWANQSWLSGRLVTQEMLLRNLVNLRSL